MYTMLENNLERPKTGIPPLVDVPSFHFTTKETRGMIEKGMTEDEIEEKRRGVLNKIARAQSTKH